MGTRSTGRAEGEITFSRGGQRQPNVQLKAAFNVNFSVDLIVAAKGLLRFLRAVHSTPSLHSGPLLKIAIRRYYDCWMPLAAAAQASGKSGDAVHSNSTALLPPADVQWVWHCHRLNPRAYREFCSSKYQSLIDCPILEDGAESVLGARERCRQLWSEYYPSEGFDAPPRVSANHLSSGANAEAIVEDKCDLVSLITSQSSFYFQVSQPYMMETQFLRAALHRYKCFLRLLHVSEGRILCVPTCDILLMWHAHQLSPVAYATDTDALLGSLSDHVEATGKDPTTTTIDLSVGLLDTARLWNDIFGLPYQTAGSVPRDTRDANNLSTRSPNPGESERVPVALTWDNSSTNINANLTLLYPRYVMEVCIFIRRSRNFLVCEGNCNMLFRLRVLGADRLLKLDIPISDEIKLQWQKAWRLQCEVATKGLILELRRSTQRCFNAVGTTKRISKSIVTWEELQELPTLSINDRFVTATKKMRRKFKEILAPCSGIPGAHVQFGVSITPPVRAPYLLKSYPDRVTDDYGAMISSFFLKINKSEPQEGRWVSRTVLNHSRKECFIIRIRVARGIWRKGGDRPVGVDWNERVIQIFEGGWTYVSGSIGVAPGTLVASANPIADDLGQYKVRWVLSSGEVLLVSRAIGDNNWERNLDFSLKGGNRGSAQLLNGRKLAYELQGAKLEDDDEGFVTVVRNTPDAPQGKATALFNWKVSAMEVQPDEDALLVLLLCTAVLRSVADLGGEDSGNASSRSNRVKEIQKGFRDWRSTVVLENPNYGFWDVNITDDFLGSEGTAGGSASGSSGRGSSASRTLSSWEGGKSFVEHQGSSTSDAFNLKEA